MIYVPVGGRLGNQLFYYGFARYLQLHLQSEHELCFDFSNLIRHGQTYQYDKSGWEDSLQYFRTVPYHTYTKTRVCYRESNPYQLLLIAGIMLRRKLNWGGIDLQKYQYSLSSQGLFYCIRQPEGDVTDVLNYDFRTKVSNIFVRGAGETSSYLNMIRPQLLQEIVPRYPRLECNETLYRQIKETNSVCISIRRGDYFSNPVARKKFALCDQEYFLKAVDIIRDLVDNPVLFVFSDDIEWCKKNLNFGEMQCYFERGDDPVWEKLRMMYSCKHFIISNSTFSWWAQWLGTYPDKVVVSPDRWYTDHTSALVEKGFYKVPVG